jgi:hypothetical protein
LSLAPGHPFVRGERLFSVDLISCFQCWFKIIQDEGKWMFVKKNKGGNHILIIISKVFVWPCTQDGRHNWNGPFLWRFIKKKLLLFLLLLFSSFFKKMFQWKCVWTHSLFLVLINLLTFLFTKEILFLTFLQRIIKNKKRGFEFVKFSIRKKRSIYVLLKFRNRFGTSAKICFKFSADRRKFKKNLRLWEAADSCSESAAKT